ncbi:hypothetical protein WJX82_003766 [Trebouxia sp. C0006]
MARAGGGCFAPVHAVFLVFAFICSASAASSPPPPPPSGGYAGFREQMYLNNGNTDWWSDNGTYTNWGALLFSYLHASSPADYAFQINVDSAARLWVNNTLIINATCNQTAYGSNPTSTANNATAWTGIIRS